MLQLQTILHPTDFSKQSEYAFRLAGVLARDHGARLIVLHVVPVAVAYGEMGVIVQPEGYQEGVLDQLRQLRLPDPSVRIEPRVQEGQAGTEIVRVAKEAGCDLIVMGTHGRTGLGRLLMGSVAEQVMRQAPCPVLTVKAPLLTPDQSGMSRLLQEATSG